MVIRLSEWLQITLLTLTVPVWMLFISHLPWWLVLNCFWLYIGVRLWTQNSQMCWVEMGKRLQCMLPTDLQNIENLSEVQDHKPVIDCHNYKTSSGRYTILISNYLNQLWAFTLFISITVAADLMIYPLMLPWVCIFSTALFEIIPIIYLLFHPDVKYKINSGLDHC